MARRTNLTTIRSSFSWSVSWMDSHLYSNILWLDYRVSDYLIGIFYTFKMPTSNYLITRFFDNFVLVETDLFFFCFDRLSGLLSSKFYFSYFISIINSFFYNRFVFRSRRFLSKRVGYSRFFSNLNYESFFLSHLYKTFFFLFSINRVNINKLKSRFLYLISFFINSIYFSRFFKLYSSIFFLYVNNVSSRKKITFFSNNIWYSRVLFGSFFSSYLKYKRRFLMHILLKNNVLFLSHN